MTAEEYAEYKESFGNFMEKEGLNNLSNVPYKCPDCDVPYKCSACPQCGKDAGSFPIEPYFGRKCIICGALPGNRYECNGYSDRDKCIKQYSCVCDDCVYYAEYGRLDDITMDSIGEQTMNRKRVWWGVAILLIAAGLFWGADYQWELYRWQEEMNVSIIPCIVLNVVGTLTLLVGAIVLATGVLVKRRAEYVNDDDLTW